MSTVPMVFKNTIKFTTKITYCVWRCDAMMLHFLDVSNNEICFVYFESKFIVCDPARDITWDSHLAV